MYGRFWITDNNMSDINELTKQILGFCEERDWRKFHHPKDLAISLLLEATELLEHFQWRNGKEFEGHIKKDKEEIAGELADIFYWVLLMSNDLNIDLRDAFEKKMIKNAKKYPVKEFKSRHPKSQP